VATRLGYRSIPDRYKVDERANSAEGTRGNGGQPRLAHASGPDQVHQARLTHRLQQGAELPLAADEAGPRDRQSPDLGPRRWDGFRHQVRHVGQFATVRRAQLAQQRRDVALHRPDRDR
jgi:hypothetical protein